MAFKEKTEKVYIVYLKGNEQGTEILKSEEIGDICAKNYDDYFNKLDNLICNYEKTNFNREIDLSKSLKEISEGMLMYKWGEPLYCIYLRKKQDEYIAYLVEEEFLRLQKYECILLT